MTAEREAMIAAWRIKLTAAHEAYKRARDARQQIQDEVPYLPMSDGGLAYRQALMAESLAQIEYARVLCIFSNVAVHGKRPNE